MTSQDEVIRQVADALGVESDEIDSETEADQVEAWDSMGTMSIVLWLHETFGIELAPSETAELQSMKRIFQLLRTAGHLA